MGNLLDAVQSTNVVERINAGRQASVQTKDLVVDQGRQGQVVEEIGKESGLVRWQLHAFEAELTYFQTFALPYLRKHSS